MKISGIDKDFEDIIYYLDAKGYKPYASCDGVEANHKRPEDVNNAYIGFLKSPKVIDLMSAFLNDKEKFEVTLKSEDHVKPWELYGNIISGTTYQVYFNNKTSENTVYFKDIIKNIAEEKETAPNVEKKKIEMIDKVLKENSDSDVAFEVTFNGNYAPYTGKTGRINQLNVTTKSGEEQIEGNINITTERNMEVLAGMLSEKYNMTKRSDSIEDEYPETEFITSDFDKTRCTIYFTDEHFEQILEKIKYIREIAHTLPTFEGREWIGSDEELMDEYYRGDYYDEGDELEDGMLYDFKEDEGTPLKQREEKLFLLEQEAEELLKQEQEITKLIEAENGKLRE